MTAEDTNTHAWQIYGRRQLARACTPPVPDRLGSSAPGACPTDGRVSSRTRGRRRRSDPDQ
ncbi:hypothetical protein [Streptomyces mutabilis]|uniref:hypothetical protein n=1 Tax=Streptomyces mutabilis TaxID=67332 RepID=UPI003432EEE2